MNKDKRNARFRRYAHGTPKVPQASIEFVTEVGKAMQEAACANKVAMTASYAVYVADKKGLSCYQCPICNLCHLTGWRNSGKRIRGKEK